MTPHPQQEYIITEGQLKRLEKNGVSSVSNNIAEQVRSRPTSAPAAPETLYTPEMVRNRIEYIRNQTLDKIIPTLGRAIQTDISDNDYVMIEDLESVIEFLRTPSTHGPERK